jgi:hypothetical protein
MNTLPGDSSDAPMSPVPSLGPAISREYIPRADVGSANMLPPFGPPASRDDPQGSDQREPESFQEAPSDHDHALLQGEYGSEEVPDFLPEPEPEPEVSAPWLRLIDDEPTGDLEILDPEGSAGTDPPDEEVVTAAGPEALGVAFMERDPLDPDAPREDEAAAEWLPWAEASEEEPEEVGFGGAGAPIGLGSYGGSRMEFGDSADVDAELEFLEDDDPALETPAYDPGIASMEAAEGAAVSHLPDTDSGFSSEATPEIESREGEPEIEAAADLDLDAEAADVDADDDLVISPWSAASSWEAPANPWEEPAAALDPEDVDPGFLPLDPSAETGAGQELGSSLPWLEPEDEQALENAASDGGSDARWILEEEPSLAEEEYGTGGIRAEAPELPASEAPDDELPSDLDREELPGGAFSGYGDFSVRDDEEFASGPLSFAATPLAFPETGGDFAGDLAAGPADEEAETLAYDPFGTSDEEVDAAAAPPWAEDEPAGAGDAPSDPAAAEGYASAMGEVAERLERIAASLRSRRPADLVAGGSDPLELLVAGFVLGYAQGSRRRGAPD